MLKIVLLMVSDCCWIVISYSLMFSITKDGEPVGIPSKQNPSVNSIGVGKDGLVLFDLVEYLCCNSC